MYRVNDKPRVKKTAQLICQGLEACLDEKPLSKITVLDIHRKCFVSRATFYRLFDSVEDVLAYVCDEIFDKRLQAHQDMADASKKERALFVINIWLAHPKLIKAIIENNLGYLLYHTHIKHLDELKGLYPIPFSEPKKIDYFVGMLTAFMVGTLHVYYDHQEKDCFEEAYATVCDCISLIDRALTGNKTGQLE